MFDISFMNIWVCESSLQGGCRASTQSTNAGLTNWWQNVWNCFHIHHILRSWPQRYFPVLRPRENGCRYWGLFWSYKTNIEKLEDRYNHCIALASLFSTYLVNAFIINKKVLKWPYEDKNVIPIFIKSTWGLRRMVLNELSMTSISHVCLPYGSRRTSHLCVEEVIEAAS